MNNVENTYKLSLQNVQDLTDLRQFFDLNYINKQFYRKLIVRNLFSIIESYLFVTRELIKIKLTVNTNQEGKLSLEELFILNGKNITLSDKGEPKMNEAIFNFEAALRFTLNSFSKVYSCEKPNYSDKNYDRLIKMSKRRNQLTHPKLYIDQIISDDEMKDVMDGLNWFMIEHTKNSNNFKF